MTQILSKIQGVYTNEPLFPLSVAHYHTMIDHGLLTDDDPVELLEGVLVTHMPKNPPHSFVLDALQEVLRGILPHEWMLRSQEPITLDDSEPEPDLVIASGSRHSYSLRHPGPIDLLLVIEVSDSTLSRDLGIKKRVYARGGINEYWVIDLNDLKVHVFIDPDLTGKEPTYRIHDEYSHNDVVPFRINGVPVGEISVQSILP